MADKTTNLEIMARVATEPASGLLAKVAIASGSVGRIVIADRAWLVPWREICSGLIDCHRQQSVSGG
ncbi:hypothetical protein [Methylocystis heyeri]|uniref:Uncharacterized protein n=1 Tax=Methylocystis heyeri TaxID=391905 RepID=A0A6B8KHY5_9HYPH|nr:hypothetical protein [Methylocystis heyeri]QGM46621.1 hypothetical protein H2LOC_013475 [Methylocystis heyeri]